MRILTMAAAAALLIGSTAASAQDTATPQENLDCAIWTSVIVGGTEDPAVQQGFGFAMNWFVGLYEGATGVKIDTVIGQRIAQLDEAEFEAIGARCMPRMQQYGQRLSQLAAVLQQQGN